MADARGRALKSFISGVLVALLGGGIFAGLEYKDKLVADSFNKEITGAVATSSNMCA